MSINESALKKFAETFGPAIEAIPAVIEAASKVKDYEKLVSSSEDRLREIEEVCQRELAAKAKSMQIAEDKLQEVYLKKVEALNDLSEVETTLSEASANALSVTANLKAETEKALRSRQSQIDGLSDVYRSKVAALEEGFSKEKKALDSEIKKLVAKRDSVEASLSRLKDKLG
jgi:hypothetical protein